MDRHAILSALRRASIREIDVAGIKLHIRGMTGAERFDLAARTQAAKGGEGKVVTDAELCSWCMCSADGERLYQDATELSNVDGHSLEQIAREILKASHLLTEDGERVLGESQASPS